MQLEGVDRVLVEASQVSDSTTDCIFLEQKAASTQTEEDVISTCGSIVQKQCVPHCIPKMFFVHIACEWSVQIDML